MASGELPQAQQRTGAVIDQVDLSGFVQPKRGDPGPGLEEGLHLKGVPGGMNQSPDGTGTVIAKEIDPSPFGQGRSAVDIAASHRTAVGMRILGHRPGERRTPRRLTLIRMQTFIITPAEIQAAWRAGRDKIDLLPFVLTDVGDVKVAGQTIERKAPGVAQPIRPDFRAATCG